MIEWYSFAAGMLSVVGMALAAILLAFVISVISDWAERFRQEKARKALCRNCMQPYSDHVSKSIPGDPFNSYLACPKYREHWEDADPKHMWKVRSEK